jgi:NADH:ubiquinone oxidoreductase subunit E
VSGAASFELLVCVNRRFGGDKPSCAVRGSPALADALERALAEGAPAVKLVRSPCQSACDRGPAVRLVPGPVFFFGMKPDEIPAVIARIAGIAARP